MNILRCTKEKKIKEDIFMRKGRDMLLYIVLPIAFLIIIPGTFIKLVKNDFKLSIFEKTKLKCLVRAVNFETSKINGRRGIITCVNNKGEYQITTYELSELEKYELNREYTFNVLHKRNKNAHTFLLSK
jgi:hypothetical protein